MSEPLAYERQCYRAFKTILEMMRARNYLVEDGLFNCSFEEFIEDTYDANGFEKPFTHSITDEIIVVIFSFPESSFKKADFDSISSKLQSGFAEIQKCIIVIGSKTGSKKQITGSILKKVNSRQNGILFQSFVLQDLLVNITKHVLVPQHIPLTSEEKQELLDKYKLKETQLPRIRKDDPVTKFFGLQPGDVFKILRKSETAGRYVTYRLVV
eukprot:TRINITY_DN2340_c0_g1_i2.p1 TRINITY_DN2340_c0_g1~~TRINITY_DN2340_c0_g1_i2.p1  ORF type:complete len:223 (+),score=56.95 TRINITY_DN2340_c0_g1_i2:35-670(+)